MEVTPMPVWPGYSQCSWPPSARMGNVDPWRSGYNKFALFRTGKQSVGIDNSNKSKRLSNICSVYIFQKTAKVVFFRFLCSN